MTELARTHWERVEARYDELLASLDPYRHGNTHLQATVEAGSMLQYLAAGNGIGRAGKGEMFSWGGVGNYTDPRQFVETLRPFFFDLLNHGLGDRSPRWEGPRFYHPVVVLYQREDEAVASAIEVGLYGYGTPEVRLTVKEHGPQAFPLTGDLWPVEPQREAHTQTSVVAFVRELERVPWGELRTASGYGGSVPEALAELARAGTRDEAERAFRRLDNHIVVQGTTYEAGVHAVLPLLLIAAKGSEPAAEEALSLLIELTTNGNVQGILDRHPLVRRCVERAREGLAIIYSLLGSANATIRRWSVILLDNLDPDAERLAWHMARTAQADPDETVRSEAAGVLRRRAGATDHRPR